MLSRWGIPTKAKGYKPCFFAWALIIWAWCLSRHAAMTEVTNAYYYGINSQA
jgi:hypothetical protein